jgi:hypothetical protein
MAFLPQCWSVLSPMRSRLGRLAAVMLIAGVALVGMQSAKGGPLSSEGSVEVAFSPADDAEALVLRVIDAARRTLYVQAYVFTSRPVATALIRAHQRGVSVEVLADAGMNARAKGKCDHGATRCGHPRGLRDALRGSAQQGVDCRSGWSRMCGDDGFVQLHLVGEKS